jgi:hypothetical protein
MESNGQHALHYTKKIFTKALELRDAKMYINSQLFGRRVMLNPEVLNPIVERANVAGFLSSGTSTSRAGRNTVAKVVLNKQCSLLNSTDAFARHIAAQPQSRNHTSYSGLVTRLKAAYSVGTDEQSLNAGIYGGEVPSSYRETSLEQIQNYFASASFYLSGTVREPGYRWGSGPYGSEESAKRASLPSNMRG